MKNFLLLINIFPNLMFFLFIKQGKSIAISLHFAIAIIVILTYLNNGILKRMAKETHKFV